MLRFFVRFVFVIAGFLFSVQFTYACSCGHTNDRFKEVQVRKFFNGFEGQVFVGEVIELRVVPTLHEYEFGPEIREVTVVVEEFWKRPTARTVKVYTGTNSAACGVDFIIGQQYLFTPSPKTKRPEVDICDYFAGVELDKNPKTLKLIKRILGKSTKVTSTSPK